jgi:hypothetical protein
VFYFFDEVFVVDARAKNRVLSANQDGLNTFFVMQFVEDDLFCGLVYPRRAARVGWVVTFFEAEGYSAFPWGRGFAEIYFEGTLCAKI